MKDFKNKKIWIIGASSGIGEELALQLSKLGAILTISARSNSNLEKLHKKLHGGKNHLQIALDVCDLKSMADAYKIIKQKHGGVDCVIYNAGIYEPMNVANFDLLQAQKIVNINFEGALRTLSLLLEDYISQKSGHLVFVASVAGYRGLANSLAYGASKAALINLAESLKIDLSPYNVKVQLVNPGFVKTRLTDKNKFKMPFIITAHKAAQEIINGMKSNKFEIHFPKRFTFILKFLTILPYKIYFRLIKNFS